MTDTPPCTAPADPPRRTALRTIGALGLLAGGCGGGTGDLAGVGSGGTGQVASFSTGAISGFGSVIVNGVRWDDTAARVTDDLGRNRTLAQLAIGMIVEIEGRADVSSGVGTADRIRVVSELKGTIASVDATARRFVVLGVVVQAGDATSYADARGFASLAVGDEVEVHGFTDAGDGVLRATRIERRAAGDTEPAHKLRGTIGTLDASAGRFRVGALLVDYRRAVIENLPSGGLANGLAVRLEASIAPAASTWVVDRVTVVQRSAGDDGRTARIEGAIGDFESVARFRVAGVPVDASGAAFAGGVTASTLRDGLRIRVTGTVSAGRVVASTVQGRRDDEVSGDADDEAEFKGTVTRFLRLGDFTVRDGAGRLFVVDASRAEIRGGTQTVSVGSVVEVRGRRGAVIVATRVEVER